MVIAGTGYNVRLLSLDPPSGYLLCFYTNSPGKSIEKASELAQKAFVLDDSLPWIYILLAYFYLVKRHHERAVAKFELALAFHPNSARANTLLGRALHYAGSPSDAIQLLERAGLK